MSRLLRVCAAAALVVISCSGSSAPSAPAAHPHLDRIVAEQFAIGADQAAQSALADLDPTRLALFFSGRALRNLIGKVGWLRARGLRSETASAHRAVASWDGHTNEVVIQVEAQYRLVSATEPDPPWSRSMRQWWSRLAFASVGWRVIDDQDLPPDQWRSLSTWDTGAEWLA